jgi:hypothetical protein
MHPAVEIRGVHDAVDSATGGRGAPNLTTSFRAAPHGTTGNTTADAFAPPNQMLCVALR